MTRKTSDAQMRAVLKYRAKNKDGIHKVTFDIYDSKDPELWPWLMSQDEKPGTVIRRLMHDEIERTKWKPDDTSRKPEDDELIG